jgi:hypothetical protein
MILKPDIGPRLPCSRLELTRRRFRTAPSLAPAAEHIAQLSSLKSRRCGTHREGVGFRSSYRIQAPRAIAGAPAARHSFEEWLASRSSLMDVVASSGFTRKQALEIMRYGYSTKSRALFQDPGALQARLSGLEGAVERYRPAGVTREKWLPRLMIWHVHFLYYRPESISVRLLEVCRLLGHGSSPAVFGAMLLKSRSLVRMSPRRVAENLAVLNKYLSYTTVQRVVTVAPELVSGYAVDTLTSALDVTFDALSLVASRDRVEKSIAHNPRLLLRANLKEHLARSAVAVGVSYEQVRDKRCDHQPLLQVVVFDASHACQRLV